MFSVVHANVLGVVIAPRGTEHLPKDRRMHGWKTMIGPLVQEVAEYEEFPADDVERVRRALFQYCLRKRLAISMDEKDRPQP